EWGDTASISALVYKNFLNEFSGAFRAKNEPDVTADIKWYYIYVPEGISKFTDIIPPQYDNKAVVDFKLNKEQESQADSIIFSIDAEGLLFFLKEGHFQVVEKQTEYTIVDF